MAKQITALRFVASVRLTPVGTEHPNGIEVAISDLLTYSQQVGFTRLRLLGRRTLDVAESVEHIDGIIRQAASV